VECPAAHGGQDASRENRIRTLAQRIAQAAAGLGEPGSHDRLSTQFRVSPQVVADLHEHKLDSGEVSVVLALAELGNASPDAILGWWANGRQGWGEIAGRLQVDARRLLTRLEEVRLALLRPGR
jgi:hypothetical protein